MGGDGERYPRPCVDCLVLYSMQFNFGEETVSMNYTSMIRHLLEFVYDFSY